MLNTFTARATETRSQTCRYHETQTKESQSGGWYCPKEGFQHYQRPRTIWLILKQKLKDSLAKPGLTIKFLKNECIEICLYPSFEIKTQTRSLFEKRLYSRCYWAAKWQLTETLQQNLCEVRIVHLVNRVYT